MLEELRYYSFLLRAWRSGPDAAPTWRVSLEDVRTGEQRAFASLAQAFTFLEGQAARSVECAPATRPAIE